MGCYNSQYEDYYNSLRRRNNIRRPVKYNGLDNNLRKKNSNSNYFTRRIIIDLVGVLVLFGIVISCKLVVNSKTQAVYNYSKQMINQNYDYKALISQIKNINFNDVSKGFMNFIENVKSKVTGTNTIDNKIKKNFALPISGIETSAFGYRKDPVTNKISFHEGVDIEVNENANVKAAYYGKIKDCGNDGAGFGNYILIDHGDGIETKYGHLKKILVKKDDAVKKGQIIAKSGNTGKSTGPHLHFELLYMGENKNPDKYFNIVKK